MSQNYFIKPGYRCNLTPEGSAVKQYAGAPSNDRYQLACYRRAAQLMVREGWTSCVELGSGAGSKLARHLGPVSRRLVGMDRAPAVEAARRAHPEVEWVAVDLDAPEPLPDESFDLVLSFDVIEHMVHPEHLVRRLRHHAKPDGRILISTPERDVVRGREHMGPPRNRLHIREWNRDELRRFLEDGGLEVLDHRLVPSKDPNLLDRLKGRLRGRRLDSCQLAECVVAA